MHWYLNEYKNTVVIRFNEPNCVIAKLSTEDR